MSSFNIWAWTNWSIGEGGHHPDLQTVQRRPLCWSPSLLINAWIMYWPAWGRCRWEPLRGSEGRRRGWTFPQWEYRVCSGATSAFQQISDAKHNQQCIFYYKETYTGCKRTRVKIKPYPFTLTWRGNLDRCMKVENSENLSKKIQNLLAENKAGVMRWELWTKSRSLKHPMLQGNIPERWITRSWPEWVLFIKEPM